jgi:hypothetical protein
MALYSLNTSKAPISLIICIVLFGCQIAQAAAFETLGVALTPAHFPRHSGKDVDDMFRLGKQIGGAAVFIYQWSQPDFKEIASKMVDAAKAANLLPIVALSPTKLEGTRGEYDVPASVRSKAGRNVSFHDKNVYEPFMADAMELARMKIPYLCLATEINMLAFKDIKEYIYFAAVYKRVYAEVKKISPSTKVFVSFQWDFLYTMDTKESSAAKIKEHSKLIDIFRPELDLVAFTSYPFINFSSPTAIPANYYQRIYDHINGSDEVMFMEIGWPSAGKGSEASQTEFIQRLPSLMANVRPKVLAWSLLHDVSGEALPGDLSSTGLSDNSGKPKRSFAAFEALRDK